MADGAPYEDLTNEQEVEDLMKEGGGTAILDFWSASCGPCMAMAKDFAHVAGQFDSEELRFCKINTGTHGHLAAPFSIRSVPTILFIHDGKVLDARVGRLSARELGEKAEWLLKKATRGPGLLSRLFG
jgi:thioredoxin 1